MSNSAKAMSVAEQESHKAVQEGRIVADEQIDRALKFLRDSAKDIGKAREDLEIAASRIKRIEALEFLGSQKNSVEARKAEARTSKAYMDADTDHAIAAGKYEQLKALRDAASILIEVWRTEAANVRAIR